MSSKIKVSTILYTSYKTSEGKHNLKIRISFNGYQKNISTSFYFTKEEYKEIRGKSNTRIFSKTKRDHIKEAIFDEQKKYKTIVNNLKILTLDALEKELNKEDEKYNLELFSLLKKFEKQYRANNQVTSADKCKETRHSIGKVLNISQIAMVDITPAFLQTYEKEALELNYSTSTVGIYLRYVRVIWNYCVNNDLLEQQLYPFGRQPKYTIPKSKKKKSALDTVDMDYFKTHKIEGVKRFYLDLFLLSYYTFGINLIDILRLEHVDIYNGFIDTTRRKTDFAIKIPLRAEAIKIITMHRVENSKYLFGKLKGNETAQQLKDRSKYYSKKINKVLADICKENSIEKKVTFYTARHTAVNQLLIKGTTVQMIAQLLGHQSITTTENYIKGLPDYDIKNRVLNIAM